MKEGMMNRKFGLAPLIGLIVTAVLILSGCSQLGATSDEDRASTSASAEFEQVSDEASDTARTHIPTDLEREKEAAASDPASDGTTGVEMPDGTITAMPVVGTSDVTLTSADTTGNPNTPATFSSVRDQCENTLLTWKALVDCVGDAQWYKDAVNARSANTGFSWADVEKWASDPQLDGKSQLTIQVYGGPFSDEQARDIAEDLVGNPALVAELNIVRHDVGSWVNTMSPGARKVTDFMDMRNMVRVSLSPVLYNQDGTVQGLSGNSGIFIDCLNIWHKVKRTWECVDASCTPPPPPPPTDTPRCPYNPALPPDSPDCRKPKDVTQGTQHQGNNAPGGGGREEGGSDEGVTTTPAAGDPPVVYTPPPAPEPDPVPTSTPRPTPPADQPPPVVVEPDPVPSPAPPPPADW